MSSSKISKDLRKFANPAKKKVYQNFFKTGKGQYGEGDIFIGVTVPQIRALAKKYKETSFADISKLLNSKVHEERLCALLLLVYNYEKGDTQTKEKIAKFYLKNTKKVNNWDLVDLTAPKILGDYLLDKDRKILYKLARSKDLWEKRISVLSTYRFIREKDFKDALKISEMHLKDEHDLMHKAVGWMLREVGNRDLKVEERFLKKHSKKMPRTMLRYAIEKFPEKKRKFYMKK